MAHAKNLEFLLNSEFRITTISLPNASEFAYYRMYIAFILNIIISISHGNHAYTKGNFCLHDLVFVVAVVVVFHWNQVCFTISSGAISADIFPVCMQKEYLNKF